MADQSILKPAVLPASPMPLFRGIYAVLARIATCREIRVFCAFFFAKIFIRAIFHAFSISDVDLVRYINVSFASVEL